VNEIPLHRVHLTGSEHVYLDEVLTSGNITDGSFTTRCESWFREYLGARQAHLTPSCTDALEMASLLCDIDPADEVILPSFTYVSTANAFVLRGAVPVFVDIDPNTLTLDVGQVEDAITPRTRAIVAVHYAGTACDMEALCRIADERKIWLIEDAAHALLSRTLQGRFLGTIAHLGCFSFHKTKNITSGQGGALIVNDLSLVERASTIWHRGTNRDAFNREQLPYYHWIDKGSSYQPGELIAAFLWAQLEQAEEITARRLQLQKRYLDGLESLANTGYLELPAGNRLSGNGHLIYVLAASKEQRDHWQTYLAKRGIESAPHYQPLHRSPAGLRWGRTGSSMTVTERISDTLLRLPIYYDMQSDDVDRVLCVLADACKIQSC